MQTEKPVRRAKEKGDAVLFKEAVVIGPTGILYSRDAARNLEASINDASSTIAGHLFFGVPTASSNSWVTYTVLQGDWQDLKPHHNTIVFNPIDEDVIFHYVRHAADEPVDLKKRILQLLDKQPKLDDEEIADSLGIVPFEASKLLRQMESKGQIRRV